MAKAPESFRVIRDAFSAAGLGDAAIAGVLANAEAESGGDPKAIGDGGNAIGLFQWNGPRANALMDFAEQTKRSAKDPALQAQFALRELQQDHPDLLKKLHSVNDPRAAAQMFMAEFERPAEGTPDRADGGAAAMRWLKRNPPARVPMGGGAPQAAVIQPAADPGIVDRVVEGARRGWGEGPVGLGPEAAALADKTGILGPLLRGGAAAVDALGRATGALIGGGAAGVTEAAKTAGLIDAGQQGRLERDLVAGGELFAASAPLLRPTGLVGPRDVMPRAADIQTARDGATPAPVARPAEPRPVTPLPAGAIPEAPPAGLPTPAAAPPPAAPVIAEARALAGPVVRPNMARITSTDEARNLISETAEVYRGSIDEARRGVVTHEATRALADQLATTPDSLVKGHQPGGVLSAEQMLAARDALVTSAEEVMAKAREAQERGGAANEELFQLINRHRAVQEAVQGYTAEAGRLLNSFSIMSKDGRSRIVREAIENDGGQWSEIVNKLANATPDELPGAIRELPGATTMDKLHYGWINALLSSPQTHMANILGNTASAVSSLVESAVAEGIGAVGRVAGVKGGVQLGETAARAGGMLRGMVEGFSAAYDSLRRGTLTPLGKVDDGGLGRAYQALVRDSSSGKTWSSYERGAGGAIIGRVPAAWIKTAGQMMMPTTWLGAEDAMFKAIAYRGEMGALAVRFAKAEGKTGDALRARIRELGRAPSEEMKSLAERAADYGTFSAELGRAGKALQAVRRDVPTGRWIVPFLRTPANILKYAGERSPLGALRLVKPKRFGLDSMAAKQEVLSRAIVGTSVGLIAADLASQGMITGSGPSDAEQRSVWLADHQPYSIKWGDKWISYNRLDPLSLQIGAVADMVRLSNELGDKELEDKAVAVVGGLSRYLMSTTWLSGPVAWLLALADPARYGDGPIQQLVGSVVPAGVGWAARTGDTDENGEQVQRPTENVVDAIMARIPGVRQELPEGVDIQGRTITTGRPAATPLLPFKEKSAAPDPVARAMEAAGYFPTRPTGRFTLGDRSFELTGRDLSQFRRDAGGAFRETAKAVLANPVWFNLEPAMQQELLRRAHSKAVDYAKSRAVLRASGRQPLADAATDARQRLASERAFAKEHPHAAAELDDIAASRKPE